MPQEISQDSSPLDRYAYRRMLSASKQANNGRTMSERQLLMKARMEGEATKRSSDRLSVSVADEQPNPL